MRQRHRPYHLWPLGACLATALCAAEAPSQPPTPHVACYDAARAGATAPYDCDLAVEAARGADAPALLAGALANRALIFARDGNLEAARADLDAALALTPDDAALHGNLGNLLLRLGRPADALAAHDAAVRLRPNDALHRYNRAFSYRILGDPVQAAQAIESLTIADPGDAVSRPDRPAADAFRSP